MSIRTLATLAAVAAAFASQAAFATSGFTPSNNESSGQFHPIQSSKTRAEVKQELEAAKRDGTFVYSGEATIVPQVEAPRGALSRDAVKSELRRWQKNPVTADGYRQVPGGPGFIYSGSSASNG